MEIEKVYEPQRFEPHWAARWVNEEMFRVEAEPGKPYFSLAIPPPNVTGSLHMGHMFEHAIIDALIRWHRMCGERTLWVPGTDHAGIATELMVDRQLQTEEGKSKRDIPREEFLERVWKWKEKNGGRIVEQMKAAGVSCDWSRERFTMDPGLSRAVREVFVRLYEKGLIYRGDYMLNWCPRCQTVLSDLEVEHEEQNGSLWHIRYAPGLVVATTRPETMLGDTAVAINPEDPRAATLGGKNVELPLTGRQIPVILDNMAELGFGTGAVKITPAHDPNDFEAGKRHNLPSIKVIGEDGKMTAAAGKFAGMDRFEARKAVVAELEALGLLEKVEPHKLSVGHCHRCKTIVEPLVSTQWWMKMKPLAEPAIAAVRDGRITFVPENWAKTYFHWMENIRDWCISRQLWWGHRIPAWHCGQCGEVIVAREDPAECKCGSKDLKQDRDVLDTWFSSGLWPFSTLGWPEQTADLKSFYPTSLLVTGFDIIFFWAARMIMFGLEIMGDVPFRQVHIHGLVRDAERQKMSKTKGNVIDPLVLNEKYGTDAVRFALLVSAAPGGDIALSEDRIDSEKAFANKIWNASRLLFSKPKEGSGKPVSLADRWIAHRVNEAAAQANRYFELHRYDQTADVLYHFWWGDFCDWYLELKKLDEDWSFAYIVYEQALRLLHPLMPFITEELWQRLELGGKTIATQAYPLGDAKPDPAAEEEMAAVQAIITDARTQRADGNVDPKQTVDAILSATGAKLAVAQRNVDAISRLARVKLELRDEEPYRLKLALKVDRSKLEKEIAELEKVIANSQRQLSNEGFLAKAPAKVTDGMRAKQAEYEAQVAKLRTALAEMKIEWFATLDSTMLEARRRPALGRVIVADEQTAGMGRHGRTWHSAAGEGLYVSIVVAPVPLLTLALGLAVRRVIGERADLRWPNDVLLRERKVAGILAQTEGDVVIAGIGINVKQQSFPEGLDTPATSLALEGIETTREALLNVLLKAVNDYTALPPEEILRQFSSASTYVNGRRVRADGREGVTCGLDSQGFLRLREDNGSETMILAGGVRPI